MGCGGCARGQLTRSGYQLFMIVRARAREAPERPRPAALARPQRLPVGSLR